MRIMIVLRSLGRFGAYDALTGWIFGQKSEHVRCLQKALTGKSREINPARARRYASVKRLHRNKACVEMS